jgi:hypothetical protein
MDGQDLAKCAWIKPNIDSRAFGDADLPEPFGKIQN